MQLDFLDKAILLHQPIADPLAPETPLQSTAPALLTGWTQAEIDQAMLHPGFPALANRLRQAAAGEWLACFPLKDAMPHPLLPATHRIMQDEMVFDGTGIVAAPSDPRMFLHLAQAQGDVGIEEQAFLQAFTLASRGNNGLFQAGCYDPKLNPLGLLHIQRLVFAGLRRPQFTDYSVSESLKAHELKPLARKKPLRQKLSRAKSPPDVPCLSYLLALYPVTYQRALALDAFELLGTAVHAMLEADLPNLVDSIYPDTPEDAARPIEIHVSAIVFAKPETVQSQPLPPEMAEARGVGNFKASHVEPLYVAIEDALDIIAECDTAGCQTKVVLHRTGPYQLPSGVHYPDYLNGLQNQF